jgi:hypothetical protein
MQEVLDKNIVSLIQKTADLAALSISGGTKADSVVFMTSVIDVCDALFKLVDIDPEDEQTTPLQVIQAVNDRF